MFQWLWIRINHALYQRNDTCSIDLNICIIKKFANVLILIIKSLTNRFIKHQWSQPDPSNMSHLRWLILYESFHNSISEHVFNYWKIIIQQFWVKLNMTRPIPCIGQFSQSNAGIAVKISGQFDVLKLEK